MTLEEHILKAENDANMAEFDTEWGIGNYFIDRAEALEYAKECRQLAEWLKELKRQREAWEKVKAEIERNAFSRYASNYDLGLCRALEIIDKHLQEVKTDADRD